MYYITGDVHGDQIGWDIGITNFLKAGDSIIVAGDFGIGFFDGRYWSEEMFFDDLGKQEYTILFCDGNHENFDRLNKYKVSQWHGGRVHFVRKNIIHLMRGEIYEIEGKKLFVFGGGFSIDKDYRLPRKSWWPEEMPDEKEYKNASDHLEKLGWKVDYILTHTAPLDTVKHMTDLENDCKRDVVEEYPLSNYLGEVERVTEYKKWYFGHFHVDAVLEKDQYAVYKGIREFHTGKLVRMRP